MIVFGPVPSRRLGQSLGVNNIPPKICTYSCTYCQVGRTLHMQVERDSFYTTEEIVAEVHAKVTKAKAKGESIDYLTFVPDGEPTLDRNLGHEIHLLRPIGIKIAVITNASLLWREDVRDELMHADCVSLKVDTIYDQLWRRLNRPHKRLHLDSILCGIAEFQRHYRGYLMTETMLVKGVNDDENSLKGIASFLSELEPNRAFLSTPTRPPADEAVFSPDESVINNAYQILSKSVSQVEYLIGYEGNAFACTGDVVDDLLSITAVHPMREDAVYDYLLRAKLNWDVVRKMIEQGQLIETDYDGSRFYMRALPERR